MRVDLVLENGRFFTQDTNMPLTDAIAVQGGDIIARGNEALELNAKERIDLGGRAVLPGFNDVHTHSVWFGTTLMEIDLSHVRAIEEIYAAIEDYLQQHDDLGPHEWIVASGYNQALLNWQVADRDVLDRVCQGRPLWIKFSSGHACQLNGVGLSHIGMSECVESQPEGGQIVVDSHGRPTGVLEEQAMTLVRDLLLPAPIATIDRALELATAKYAEQGLTSVTDAGVAAGWIGNAPGEMEGYQRALERGVLRTRMQVMPEIGALELLPGHPDEPVRRGLRGGLRTGWGNDHLQLGPVKVFTDGSILGRTAAVEEEYDNCPGNHGYLQEDAEVLRAKVLEAYAGGWSLALHAVGDTALDLALDIIEEGISRHGRNRVPNRVEHGVVVRPDQVERLAQLDVVCVVQSSFIPGFGGSISGALGPKRSDWSVRARSLLDAGLPLPLSSDRPVTAGLPLVGIQAYVERITEDGGLYNEKERLTAWEAVHSATVGSAEATGQQHRKGRLSEGLLADMVVLEAHPAEVSTSDIHAIPVQATLLGGDFTHRIDSI